MISTQKIRDNFSRSAIHYEKYADIQAKLAQELLEEVIGAGYTANEVLDIGCGTGWLLGELKRFLPQSRLWGLDISLAMARKTKAKIEEVLTADAAFLPFKDKALDLVLSNAVYQWVPDLEAAFKEARRILKSGGCFMFNCFGAKTLRELRQCFGIEETFLPRADFIREALERAGFSCPEFKVRECNRHFDNLADILSWLKYIGVNRINQHQGFLTPSRLAKADHFYRSNFRGNGQVYATFEVISVKAIKAVDS
ncbi:MAG: methyltransferase domain-containing protein [Candidatus Omnitrophota bacterium]|nr:methyltransferase domain-containing protein [Candidatus Omnitrophota bacterium]